MNETTEQNPRAATPHALKWVNTSDGLRMRWTLRPTLIDSQWVLRPQLVDSDERAA